MKGKKRQLKKNAFKKVDRNLFYCIMNQMWQYQVELNKYSDYKIARISYDGLESIRYSVRIYSEINLNNNIIKFKNTYKIMPHCFLGMKWDGKTNPYRK